LEGRRGEPRTRPPYPATGGYRGKPTAINNVETLAMAAVIMRHGVDAYRSFGSPGQPGTRLYTLLGHLQRPGIVEVPFGLTLQELIERFGGGMMPGSRFHFALTGGAAGTLVSARHLDVRLDDSSAAAGVAMGAGGILVCDQSVSPVRLLRELMHFFE